jgi:hypothetical protein
MPCQTRRRRPAAKRKRRGRNTRDEDDEEIALPECAFYPGIVGAQ